MNRIQITLSLIGLMIFTFVFFVLANDFVAKMLAAIIIMVHVINLYEA